MTYSLTKNKDLANVNLRRAISMALNRKVLASTVGGANTPATTFTGPQETVHKLMRLVNIQIMIKRKQENY